MRSSGMVLNDLPLTTACSSSPAPGSSWHASTASVTSVRTLCGARGGAGRVTRRARVYACGSLAASAWAALLARHLAAGSVRRSVQLRCHHHRHHARTGARPAPRTCSQRAPRLLRMVTICCGNVSTSDSYTARLMTSTRVTDVVHALEGLGDSAGGWQGRGGVGAALWVLRHAEHGGWVALGPVRARWCSVCACGCVRARREWRVGAGVHAAGCRALPHAAPHTCETPVKDARTGERTCEERHLAERVRGAVGGGAAGALDRHLSVRHAARRHAGARAAKGLGARKGLVPPKGGRGRRGCREGAMWGGGRRGGRLGRRTQAWPGSPRARAPRCARRVAARARA